MYFLMSEGTCSLEKKKFAEFCQAVSQSADLQLSPKQVNERDLFKCYYSGVLKRTVIYLTAGMHNGVCQPCGVVLIVLGHVQA